eukprot:NODE_4908_length_723_cov_136.523490_g4745_i0.p1 GENE.NODE_4908_length_723_cov_136.523490_g4745_i0~~NODE_4908_length_723_cov_136.523490_g4745_i0.p1  ORF type:complete len:219 (+),score=4.15 NODE_4908_length_723_cov_136.523490_g4745_i0:61-657(+)
MLLLLLILTLLAGSESLELLFLQVHKLLLTPEQLQRYKDLESASWMTGIAVVKTKCEHLSIRTLMFNVPGHFRFVRTADDHTGTMWTQHSTDGNTVFLYCANGQMTGTIIQDGHTYDIEALGGGEDFYMILEVDASPIPPPSQWGLLWQPGRLKGSNQQSTRSDQHSHLTYAGVCIVAALALSVGVYIRRQPSAPLLP